MEIFANNKHLLIETIVNTGCIFCKVTEPWHNTCQTPAIEDKLDFTWTSISFPANQEEGKLYTRKTQPPQRTATKCAKLQIRIGAFTDSTKRAAILVVNDIVKDISHPLPLPNAVGQPTNQPTIRIQSKVWLVAGEGGFVELVQTTWDNHFDPVNSGGLLWERRDTAP